MRPERDVHEVFRLAELGLSQAEIARRVGIARATVRDWLRHGKADVLHRPMRTGNLARGGQSAWGTCEQAHPVEELDQPDYVYLLGQYLGDGCISQYASGYRLRLACCDAYPNMMAECDFAIRTVAPVEVRYIAKQGCTEVYATWFHWPCVMPHGEGGVKHLRKIELLDWQEKIALGHFPDMLVRGLIHSDGWRGRYRVRGANGRRYEYPRYNFCNRSDDIKELFIDACECLGVEVRRMNAMNLSVAKRASVAILDEIVGPKS